MLHLDRFLPYRLNVLSKTVSQALADHYQQLYGLSLAEWRILATLGQEQPLSSNDIVERALMDKAKVSRSVNKLVAAGLVERAVHPDDHRLLRLSFTPDGEALYRRLATTALTWERALLADLTPTEQDQLWSLMARLEDKLAATRPPGAARIPWED